MPDEHTDCESAYTLRQLVTVACRHLKRRCLADGTAQAAWVAVEFLTACMQQAGQVHQFLVGAGYGATAA